MAIPLSKATEGTTPALSPRGSSGLWATGTDPCRFTDFNKRSWWGADGEGACADTGRREHTGTLFSSAPFGCEPKTAVSNEVYFRKKEAKFKKN